MDGQGKPLDHKQAQHDIQSPLPGTVPECVGHGQPQQIGAGDGVGEPALLMADDGVQRKDNADPQQHKRGQRGGGPALSLETPQRGGCKE